MIESRLTRGFIVSYMFSSMSPTPRAPQSASSARAGSQRANTSRLPTIPTLPANAVGNMKSTYLNKTPEPISPVPPQSPKVTQSPYLDSLFTESRRKGQLSTLLGRDITLPTEANRNARLSGYLM